MDFIISTANGQCSKCKKIAIDLLEEAMDPDRHDQPPPYLHGRHSGSHLVELFLDPNGYGKGMISSWTKHPSFVTQGWEAVQATIDYRQPAVTDPEGNVLQFPLERRRLTDPKDRD